MYAAFRRAALAADLAAAFSGLGRILGGTHWPGTGELPEAAAALREAKSHAASVAAARPGEPEPEMALLLACYELGEFVHASDDRPAAAVEARELFRHSARVLSHPRWDSDRWRLAVTTWPQAVEWMVAAGAEEEARAQLDRAAALVAAAPWPTEPSLEEAYTNATAALCLGRCELLLGDGLRALGFVHAAEGTMARAASDTTHGLDAVLGRADIERYRARVWARRGTLAVRSRDRPAQARSMQAQCATAAAALGVEPPAL